MAPGYTGGVTASQVGCVFSQGGSPRHRENMKNPHKKGFEELTHNKNLPPSLACHHTRRLKDQHFTLSYTVQWRPRKEGSGLTWGETNKHAADAPYDFKFLESIYYVWCQGGIKHIKYSEKCKCRIMEIDLRILSSSFYMAVTTGSAIFYANGSPGRQPQLTIWSGGIYATVWVDLSYEIHMEGRS